MEIPATRSHPTFVRCYKFSIRKPPIGGYRNKAKMAADAQGPRIPAKEPKRRAITVTTATKTKGKDDLVEKLRNPRDATQAAEQHKSTPMTGPQPVEANICRFRIQLSLVVHKSRRRLPSGHRGRQF